MLARIIVQRDDGRLLYIPVEGYLDVFSLLDHGTVYLTRYLVLCMMRVEKGWPAGVDGDDKGSL